MATLIDMLFGCWHKNYSFPRTNKQGRKRSPAASLTGVYVVCLDCGEEFPYDWREMKVLSSKSARDQHRGRIGYGKSYGEYSLNGSPLDSLEDSKTGS